MGNVLDVRRTDHGVSRRLVSFQVETHRLGGSQRPKRTWWAGPVHHLRWHGRWGWRGTVHQCGSRTDHGSDLVDAGWTGDDGQTTTVIVKRSTDEPRLTAVVFLVHCPEQWQRDFPGTTMVCVNRFHGTTPMNYLPTLAAAVDENKHPSPSFIPCSGRAGRAGCQSPPPSGTSWR